VKRAIPSAVTLLVVLCGLLAILWADASVYRACLALIAAAVFDTLDGRLARALGAQTALGAQLDSLADAVAFGVAPAVLAYTWAPKLAEVALGIDVVGIGSFAFIACAVVRLARFNLDDDAVISRFHGMPTPAAALWVTTWIMMSTELGIDGLHSAPLVLALLLAGACLMVAAIPFPSLKSPGSAWGSGLFLASMGGGLLLLVFEQPGGTVLFGLLVLYIGRSVIGRAGDSRGESIRNAATGEN